MIGVTVSELARFVFAAQPFFLLFCERLVGVVWVGFASVSSCFQFCSPCLELGSPLANRILGSSSLQKNESFSDFIADFQVEGAEYVQRERDLVNLVEHSHMNEVCVLEWVAFAFWSIFSD